MCSSLFGHCLGFVGDSVGAKNSFRVASRNQDLISSASADLAILGGVSELTKAEAYDCKVTERYRCINLLIGPEAALKLTLKT